MEVTTEFLLTLRERVKQVFIAKTNEEDVDNITLDDNGTFTASITHQRSWGFEDCISEIVEAEDLTADLDKFVEVRKQKEKEEKEASQKREYERKKRQEEKDRLQRLAEYHKLKAEFEQ